MGGQYASTQSGAKSVTRRSGDACLQAQARALGDPTRFEIFQYLAEAHHPVGVKELARHFGFNPNAIRQHLAKLLAADMVVEQVSVPQGRGRPGRVYRQSPAAQARWGNINPYEHLCLLMSEMLRTREKAIEVGRRAGRRQRLHAESGDTLKAMVAGMEKLGFEPHVVQREEATDVLLEACPFSSAALVDPENVCQIHLGMAQGMLEHDECTHVAEERRADDPRRGGCILRIRRAESAIDAPGQAKRDRSAGGRS